MAQAPKSPPPAAKPTTAAPKSKRPWPLIIGGVAVVLALIAGFMALQKFQMPGPRDMTSRTASSEESTAPPAESSAPTTSSAAPKSTAPTRVATNTASARPAPKTSTILLPRWLRRPTQDELADFYPSGALNRAQGGRATLNCLVVDDGKLDCAVTNEAPRNLGFGAAAVGASKRFKIAPTTLAGLPTRGRHVRLPIVFIPPKAP